MTYSNRMKNRRTKQNPWWVKPGDEHKVPYFRNYNRDNIDPYSGKVIGYDDSGWKDPGLKKRHRQYGKKIIAECVQEIEEDIYLDEKEQVDQWYAEMEAEYEELIRAMDEEEARMAQLDHEQRSSDYYWAEKQQMDERDGLDWGFMDAKFDYFTHEYGEY